MDVVFTVVLILLPLAASLYVRSREPDTWYRARENCQEFGGTLATVTDPDMFRAQVASGETTLEPEEQLWVGASLEQRPWTWHGASQTLFNDAGWFYTRQGCMEFRSPDSGTKMTSLTPQNCGEFCNWDGVIGLQNDTCLCSHDLANVSRSQPGVCHIQCPFPSTDMCGGYWSVSLYKPDNRNIPWAPGETENDAVYNCAFVRRTGKLSALQFVNAHCDMRSRYLCEFSDDIKCGVSATCIRWSTIPATWEGAMEQCKAMNGSLAVMDGPNAKRFERDLDRLPVGGFWVALRRDRTWRWINGKQLPMSLQKSRALAVDGKTCAVIERTIDGAVEMSADTCEENKYYLCQYDYMPKRARSDTAPDSVRSDSTFQYNNFTALNGSDVGDVTDGTVPTDATKERGTLIFTCMYMILGFVSGMVCVLILGLIVYTIYRCRQPSADKHSRLVEHRTGSRQDVHSVTYSSKNESVRITPPHSDIMYDTVYNLETESPFRRTQRLIRMGSANTWRTPSRRVTNDVFETPVTNYTWRGVIGGNVEVINTELREPNSQQSEALNPFDICDAPRGAVGGLGTQQAGTSRDFDRLDLLCDFPDKRSNSFDYERRTNRVDSTGRSASGTDEASFLEFRSSRNSKNLNEDNIYATIKKTFEKLREDMA